MPDRSQVRPGRGATSNPMGRFEPRHSEAADDGWGILDEPLPKLETVVQAEAARVIIARNRSPDMPFTQSINPYRGCEHGCVYCYARPTHAYVNLSPGLDFETKLFYKDGADELLAKELRAKSYQCSPIALGTNTDPYQPIERRYRVTRRVLELLSACDHPVTIVTKAAALIERDLELLASMARRRLVAVFVSITTLNTTLKRTLEPRAASPSARLVAIRHLAEAGVPVGVMVAPVIPVLTDYELEDILDAAAAAGAVAASYAVLRLPDEVAGLFGEWLNFHEPLKAEHVIARLRALRGGRKDDPEFGRRLSGTGVYAGLLRKRFELRVRRLGLLDGEGRFKLDTGRFHAPEPSSPQQSLFQSLYNRGP